MQISAQVSKSNSSTLHLEVSIKVCARPFPLQTSRQNVINSYRNMRRSALSYNKKRTVSTTIVRTVRMRRIVSATISSKRCYNKLTMMLHGRFLMKSMSITMLSRSWTSIAWISWMPRPLPNRKSTIWLNQLGRETRITTQVIANHTHWTRFCALHVAKITWSKWKTI